jgi:tRNA A37 threonylcarbamoyladenosine dehydratase
VIEQLARLGVGEFALIDPDVIEMKNLNRILNATPTMRSVKYQRSWWLSG